MDFLGGQKIKTSCRLFKGEVINAYKTFINLLSGAFTL